MSKFKEKIKNIILSYCKGHTHLEFHENDFSEMLERIENVKK
jgi:hypothetical protein